MIYPFSATIPYQPEVQTDPIINIIDVVCSHFGISKEQLESPDRKRPVTTARQWAMYFMREDGSYTLQKIADQFGRDHTSVMHSHKLVSDLIGRDNAFTNTYNILSSIINKTI